MYRWLGVAVVVAGCRLHFDDYVMHEEAGDGDAGNGGDAGGANLRCNQPLEIGPGTAALPRLSAAAGGSSLAAAWITDTGSIQSAGGLLEAFDHYVPVSAIGITPTAGPWQVVSIAAHQTAIIGIGNDGTQSQIRLYDNVTGQPTNASGVGSPALISSARAAVNTGAASGPTFVFAGIAAGGSSQAAGITDTNQFSGATPTLGSNEARVSLEPIGARIAAVQVTTSATCNMISVAADLTNTGTGTAWGISNCAQPIGAHRAGRSDLLVARVDTSTSGLVHRIVLINGSNFSLANTEQMLRVPAAEPRAVGVADGYWVTYETNGSLEATHVGFTGTITKTVVLGPLASTTGHDIVQLQDHAYAVWLDDALYIARLCVE